MDIVPFTMINLTLCFVNNLTALEEIIGGARNFWIHLKRGGILSLQPDSNQRQAIYKTATLPTELWRLCFKYVGIMKTTPKYPSYRGRRGKFPCFSKLSNYQNLLALLELHYELRYSPQGLYHCIGFF